MTPTTEVLFYSLTSLLGLPGASGGLSEFYVHYCSVDIVILNDSSGDRTHDLRRDRAAR